MDKEKYNHLDQTNKKRNLKKNAISVTLSRCHVKICTKWPHIIILTYMVFDAIVLYL